MMVAGKRIEIPRAILSFVVSITCLLFICDRLWVFCHSNNTRQEKRICIELVIPSEEALTEEVPMEENKPVIKMPDIELEMLQSNMEPEEISVDNPFEKPMILEKPVIVETPKKKKVVKEKVDKSKEKKKEIIDKNIEKTEIVQSDKVNDVAPQNVQSIQPKEEKSKTSSSIKKAPVLTKAQMNENSRYLAKIMKIFEKNKKYPDDARRRHLEGKIFVSFCVDKEGKTGKVLAKTEKPKELVMAAVELIKKSKLPIPPDCWPIKSSIEIPILYKLR